MPGRLKTVTVMTTNLPTPHILVVEDDREISALVARYLRANNLQRLIGPPVEWALARFLAFAVLFAGG